MTGGQAFSINSSDLVVPNRLDITMCISGIQDSVLVLGDTFLKSVLAVFDIGEETMQFAITE
jgi:hypothetical protein